MSQKELVIEAIQKLPADASLKEIAEHIDFMAAVQKGISDIEQGHSVSHQEVKTQMATWLTE